MNHQEDYSATGHEFDIVEFTSATDYSELKRRDIRALIFYLLYIFEFTDETIDNIGQLFGERFAVQLPRHSEVIVTAKSIITARESLDAIYQKHLENWHIERLSICTKIILRFGLWEILHTKTDHRIIINEAIELAKSFDEQGAHRFINGILDSITKKQ